ncbi:MAG: alpha/beta hydrolase [Clostridia bacterium]|nr:alpha/beta hydrolase [Deltaproteobacteria bacterium]
MLLLHGFLGSGRNLHSLARRWNERESRLRLILPDLTGHGISPPLEEPVSINGVARDVLSLAEHVKADEPLTIVGHSFGGRTALAMRLLDPSRVGRIVLLDIAAGPIGTGLGGLDGVLAKLLEAPATSRDRDSLRAFFQSRGISAALTEWVILNLVQDGDVLRWRFNREALKALNEASRVVDLWPAVEAPGVNTTLIYGARSKFVALADLDRFMSTNADVIAIPNAGHFLHVDAQAELLDHLVALKL